MSRRRDSNPRPTDYKSVALPAELLRLNFLILKNVPFKWGCKFRNNFYCCKKKYNFFCIFSKIIALPFFFNEIEKDKPSLFTLFYAKISGYLSNQQPLCDPLSCLLYLLSSLQDKLHLFLQSIVMHPPYVKLRQHYVLKVNR